MKTIDPLWLSQGLGEAVAHGDWRLFFWERDQAQKVTLGDLHRVAAQYLVPSNLTVGMFIPDENSVRAAIPGTPDYQAMLRDYKGRAVVAEGERFDATPANIEARTARTTAGGIKLALLPKRTRGNVVNVVLRFDFGDEQSLRNRAEAARFAGELLMRGTTKHDRLQLGDALTAIKTYMSVSGGATGAFVSFQTDREHLAAALGIAAEMLRQPAFPQKEFEELKRKSLIDIEGQRTDPGAIANLALQRALSPYQVGDIRYVPTLDESLARVKATTLGDVKKFYHDFFGVGSAEMAFVGDFDPHEVTGLVTDLFGNWKSLNPYRRIPDVYRPVTGAVESFNTPDKANAIFLAATNLEIRDDDSAYPGLVLGNYILGGGFLNSRLASRIRQKEGLSYSVGSDVGASSLDKVGQFRAQAICAPQNTAKVEKAFQEEIARVLAEGFTAEELAAAKSGLLQAAPLAWAEDGSIAGALASQLFEGRDFHWEEQFERNVRALTPGQVLKAMQQHIDPKKLIIMTAGDFAKMK
jgi:zinc protease